MFLWIDNNHVSIQNWKMKCSNCVTIIGVIIVIVIFFWLGSSFNVFYWVIAFKQAQTVYTNYLFFSVVTLLHLLNAFVFWILNRFAIAAAIRTDLIGFIYLCCCGMMLISPRRTVYHNWKWYKFTIFVVSLLQYILYTGIPLDGFWQG